MDRAVFFGSVRRTLFGGRLASGQVTGIGAILDRAQAAPGGVTAAYDGRWLAYILATVHHETGRKMQPVRETMAATDAQAIARLNYEKLSGLVGTDLVADPARAMDGTTSVEILFVGMETGAFTGVSLADAFDATRTDWVGARRIINGRDRAADIAAYAKAYHAALTAAGLSSIKRIALS